MTPDAHARANEIRSLITSCNKDLEKWRANDACVSPCLIPDEELEIRLTIIGSLEDRIDSLREEYEKL